VSNSRAPSPRRQAGERSDATARATLLPPQPQPHPCIARARRGVRPGPDSGGCGGLLGDDRRFTALPATSAPRSTIRGSTPSSRRTTIRSRSMTSSFVAAPEAENGVHGRALAHASGHAALRAHGKNFTGSFRAGTRVPWKSASQSHPDPFQRSAEFDADAHPSERRDPQQTAHISENWAIRVPGPAQSWRLRGAERAWVTTRANRANQVERSDLGVVFAG